MIWLPLTGLGVAWLVTAKTLYARWRGRQVGRRDCERHGTKEYRHVARGHCCYDSTASADGEAAALAMIAALAFPLVLMVALVRWQPSGYVIAWHRRRQQRAVQPGTAVVLKPREWEQEIEREVGIGTEESK